jgi:hypothetical protein
MAYSVAAFPNVTAFNGRAYALADSRRGVLGGLAVGLGSVTAAGLMGSSVLVTAAWLVSSSFANNPNLRAKAPIALVMPALTRPYRRLVDEDLFDPDRGSTYFAAAPASAASSARVADLGPAAVPAAAPMSAPPQIPPKRHVSANEIPLPLPRPRPPQMQAKQEVAHPPASRAVPDAMLTADLAPAAAPAVAPVRTQQLSPQQTRDRADNAPLPPQHPPRAPQVQAKLETTRPPASAAAPEITGSIPPAGNNSNALPGRDSHTAVYDIEAHIVYLPSGERLEAHSGLGRRLDDPRYVSERGRGPTPPNVYDLALREQLFHGVRAIRLNPVGDSRMFGRDGLLAHTYMLGPSGQSFGCVSFKDYPQFLHAFLNGQIDRLVVVSHIDAKPTGTARAPADAPIGTPSMIDNRRALRRRSAALAPADRRAPTV